MQTGARQPQETAATRDQRKSFPSLDPWLIGILVLAIVVRIAVALELPHHSMVGDEAEYYGAARALAGGRGFSFYDNAPWLRAPGYIAFLAAIFKAFGPNLAVVSAVQTALSLLVVYLFYGIARHMYDRKVGLVTALLCAIYLPLAVFPQLLLSETLFLAILALAIRLLVSVRSAKVTDDAAARKVTTNVVASFSLRGSGSETPPAAGDNGPLAESASRMQPPVALSAAGTGETPETALQNLQPEAGTANDPAWFGRPSVTFALVGLLLGAGALVRGVALAMIPLVLLWMFLHYWKHWRKFIVSSALLLVGVAVLILPWTARNYLTYGEVVLVDTTGGYNFWLGAQAGRGADRITQVLTGMQGVGQRDKLAYSEGLRTATAHPDQFLAKARKEMGDLWKINFSALERFVSGFTHGLIPAWHLIAVMVLNDGLYFLTLPLAALGLMAAPRDSRKFLLMSWPILATVLAAVYFAIERFRLPMMPLLFVPAAYALVGLGRRYFHNLTIPRLAIAVALSAAALLVVLPEYPAWFWPLGISESFQQRALAAGNQLLAAGNPQAALAEYDKADQALIETKLAKAEANREMGDLSQAKRLAQQAGDIPRARAMLGILLLQQEQPDQAAKILGSPALDTEDVEAWAWSVTPPMLPYGVEIGSPVDLGFISGFYPRETENGVTFRWTRQTAQVRLGSGGMLSQRIVLRVMAHRSAGVPQPNVRLFIGGKEIGSFTAGPTWETKEVNVPNDLIAGPNTPNILTIQSDTFVPSFNDMRELGVMVDWVRIENAGG